MVNSDDFSIVNHRSPNSKSRTTSSIDQHRNTSPGERFHELKQWQHAALRQELVMQKL